MEFQELAKKLNVKNIIITNINNNYYKDNITVIINDDLAINLVGKTFSYIPLTLNGINKRITNVQTLFKKIRESLKENSI